MKWYEIQNKTSQILRDFQKDKEYQDCQITWIPYSSLLFSTISSSISAVMSRVVWEPRSLKNWSRPTGIPSPAQTSTSWCFAASHRASRSPAVEGGHLWREVNFGGMSTLVTRSSILMIMMMLTSFWVALVFVCAAPISCLASSLRPNILRDRVKNMLRDVDKKMLLRDIAKTWGRCKMDIRIVAYNLGENRLIQNCWINIDDALFASLGFVFCNGFCVIVQNSCTIDIRQLELVLVAFFLFWFFVYFFLFIRNIFI